ncbi:uncharacterized protein LOC131947583 [Physella acuta]|uniref:uncharacterized protein LOC131947583 n=1 Tax=Physella acuta TaxID=109671 RepID=UPI0027DCF498|nr:uncharacterized protein LOC131947583 [Physella acuta]
MIVVSLIVVVLVHAALGQQLPVVNISVIDGPTPFLVTCDAQRVALPGTVTQITTLTIDRTLPDSAFLNLALVNPIIPLTSSNIPPGRLWTITTTGQQRSNNRNMRLEVLVSDGTCKDAAVYKCSVTYQDPTTGTYPTLSASLTLTPKPQVLTQNISAAPYHVTYDGQSYYQEGEVVVLTCRLSVTYPVRLQWLYGLSDANMLDASSEGTLTPSTTFVKGIPCDSYIQESRLTLTMQKKYDGAMFRCAAFADNQSPSNRTYTLGMFASSITDVPPMVSSTPREGTPFTMYCDGSRVPISPNVTVLSLTLEKLSNTGAVDLIAMLSAGMNSTQKSAGRQWDIQLSGNFLSNTRDSLRISLQVYDTSCQDAALYRCNVTYKYSGSNVQFQASAFQNLTVKGIFEAALYPSNFDRQENNITVYKSNQPITLTCNATGSNNSILTWKYLDSMAAIFNGYPFANSITYTMTLATSRCLKLYTYSTLTFRPSAVSLESAPFYCVVEDGEDVMTKRLDLKIEQIITSSTTPSSTTNTTTPPTSDFTFRVPAGLNTPLRLPANFSTTPSSITLHQVSPTVLQLSGSSYTASYDSTTRQINLTLADNTAIGTRSYKIVLQGTNELLEVKFTVITEAAVTSAPISTITPASRNTTAAPGNTTSSSGNITASPWNTTASSGNITAAPGNTTSSTGSTNASSGNITASPWNTTAAPGNTTAAPRNTTSSTGNTNASSGNITTLSGNITASPWNTTTAPRGTTTSPTKPVIERNISISSSFNNNSAVFIPLDTTTPPYNPHLYLFSYNYNYEYVTTELSWTSYNLIYDSSNRGVQLVVLDQWTQDLKLYLLTLSTEVFNYRMYVRVTKVMDIASTTTPYPGDTTTENQPYIQNNKQVTALIDSDTHFQLVLVTRYPPTSYRMYRKEAPFTELSSYTYSVIYTNYKNELDVTIFDTGNEGVTSYVLQVVINGRTYEAYFTVTKAGSTNSSWLPRSNIICLITTFFSVLGTRVFIF